MRVSAKELTSLILDEDRLRMERSDRKSWKSRVTGIEDFHSSDDAPQRAPRERRAVRPQRADEEDAEYRLAIEASKYQEEEDRKKRQSRQGEPDDDDLAKAIKLSKEEEELRRRELEEQNATSLFDDDAFAPQPTGYNQGYQQGGAIDWSGNPIDQNNLMQNPTGQWGAQGFGTQPTGYQNFGQSGFGAQPTGYDAFGAQPFGAQPTGYNPYQQQQQTYGQDIFSQPSEPVAQPGTNNPWASNQPAAQPLQPAATGSNNPFAQSQQTRPSPFKAPQKQTLNSLSEQAPVSQFNSPAYNPPAQVQQPPAKQQSAYEQKLSSLLESGEGMDTFGNVGNLRIPAQHTAPGTFVNSAGHNAQRIHEQQTGNNPFMKAQQTGLQTQFTGMPQTQYGGGFGASQPMMPAATGPANMGYGGQQNSNPFGQRPQQSNGQGGDLIQF